MDKEQIKGKKGNKDEIKYFRKKQRKKKERIKYGK